MSLVRLMLAMLLLALPLAAAAQSFPERGTSPVVDAAELLSPEQEAELAAQSEAIYKATGRQFVIATVPDLQGYPIEDFGYRLGQHWKLGLAGADNGIILLVAPKDRALRIEVGKGLEPIMTDGFSGLIIDKIIVPRFKTGDMPGGIMAGAAEIAEQMKLPLEAAEARAKEKLDAERQVQASSPPSARSTPIPLGRGEIGAIVLILGMIVIVGIASAADRRSGRRGRRWRGGSAAGDIANVLLWTAVDAAVRSSSRGGGWSSGGGSGWGGGGGSSWSGGGGGFSGGGGSFGGGGASGSW